MRSTASPAVPASTGMASDGTPGDGGFGPRRATGCSFSPQGLLAALRPWQSSVSLELSGATLLPGPLRLSADRVWPNH